jgi:hypothetical protein
VLPYRARPAPIDLGQYGCIAGQDYPRHLLHAAEYNLVSRPPSHLQAQSVTTFCMCPGGEIIAATSDRGQLSTNGMSRFARASGFANAGLIVNQPDDHRDDPLSGFDVIERLERACYEAGGSDLSCPAQSVSAFVRGEAARRPAPPLSLRPAPVADRLLPATSAAISATAISTASSPASWPAAPVGAEAGEQPAALRAQPDTLESSIPGLWLAERWLRRRSCGWTAWASPNHPHRHPCQARSRQRSAAAAARRWAASPGLRRTGPAAGKGGPAARAPLALPLSTSTIISRPIPCSSPSLQGRPSTTKSAFESGCAPSWSRICAVIKEWVSSRRA